MNNNSLFTAFTTDEKNKMVRDNTGYTYDDQYLVEGYSPQQNTGGAQQLPPLQQPATAAYPQQPNPNAQPAISGDSIAFSTAIRLAAPIIGRSAPQVGQMPEWNALYSNPTPQGLANLIIKIAGIAATAQKSAQIQNNGNAAAQQPAPAAPAGTQNVNSSLEIDFLKQLNLSEKEDDKVFDSIFEDDESVDSSSKAGIDSSKNDTAVNSSADKAGKDKAGNSAEPDASAKTENTDSGKKTTAVKEPPASNNTSAATSTAATAKTAEPKDNIAAGTAIAGDEGGVGAKSPLHYSEEYNKDDAGKKTTERDQHITLTKPEPYKPDTPKLEIDFSDPNSVEKSLGKASIGVENENFNTDYDHSLDESLSEDMLDTIVGEWHEENDDSTPAVSDIMDFLARKFPEVLKDDEAVNMIRRKIEETNEASDEDEKTFHSTEGEHDFLNAGDNFDGDDESSEDDDFEGSDEDDDFSYDDTDETPDDETEDEMDESRKTGKERLENAVFEYEMHTNEENFNLNEATRWLSSKHKELIPEKNEFLSEIKNFYTEDTNTLNDDFYSNEPTLN